MGVGVLAGFYRVFTSRGSKLTARGIGARADDTAVADCVRSDRTGYALLSSRRSIVRRFSVGNASVNASTSANRPTFTETRLFSRGELWLYCVSRATFEWAMSTDTTVPGERTTCEECGLPYYVDNGACPYCGSASGDESPRSNARSASRSRATCDECGLPYYADENDDCPYCETAATDDRSQSVEPASESESEPAASESEPDPEPRSREEPPATAEVSESTDAEPSLLARISNTVRAMLTGR